MPIPTQLQADRKKYLRSKKIKEDNDCTVIALAITAGVSYGKAHETLRRLGRRRGRGVNFRRVMQKAYAEFGCEAVQVSAMNYTGRTTKTLKLPREDKYLVFTYAHVLAVQFGLVKDWSHNRNKRIKSVWRIRKVSQ